jgi:hypothetical protein
MCYDKVIFSCVHNIIMKLTYCWGLVLKCFGLRTRQHKILNVNVLRLSKHYFPQDITIFERRL